VRSLLAVVNLLMLGGLLHAGEETAVTYLPLEALVVNLEGRRHYLRTDVQLMLEGDDSIETVKVHVPAIRHALIMTLSNRPSDQLAVPEEREKLRLTALEAVRKMLERYAAGKGVRDLFFTEFLVQ
jgi:flagellar FliL protein